MSTIPKERNNFSEEQLQAAKEVRDYLIAENEPRLKSIYMAGEIVMWDEMRQLATDGREELEKELALYKTKVEFYREQTDKVRELIFSRNDIGEPCQPLYDAIFDKITSLQSSLNEKEKECVELKSYNAQILLDADADKFQQSKQIEELKAENERLKGFVNKVGGFHPDGNPLILIKEALNILSNL